MTDRVRGLGRFTLIGAFAGALSAFVFTIVHQVMISSIWFAFVSMLLAGAVSGVCLAWSYLVAVKTKSARTWFTYNSLYVVVLIALGITSMVMFDPVTTIQQLLLSKKPPTALIGRALPVTGLFTFFSAAVLSAIHRPSWHGIAAIFITNLVIVLFLGMNISILGFVALPRSSLWVLGEVLLLIVTLAAIYAFTVLFLEKERFTRVVIATNAN
jgi:hypothetical protein